MTEKKYPAQAAGTGSAWRMGRLRRRSALAAPLLAAALLAGSAWSVAAQAATKMRLVYTSSTLATASFVAADKGFFAKHGLDVTFVPIAINSQIPASLVSGSAEIGYLTTSSLVQANAGGIHLLAIAGTALAHPGATNEAVVARKGSGIKAEPKDFIGRRVGMPGIGIVMDIMFRNWLMKGGVNPAQVQIVEISSPQQMDALRGGSVDAVVANDPQLYRLVHSGVGYEAGMFMNALPGPMPIIVYTVTADYARTHRAAVLAFQAAYKEGVAWTKAHPIAARDIMAKHLHLPEAAVKGLKIPPLQAKVEPQQISIMVNMLRAQHNLAKPVDPADMVFH